MDHAPLATDHSLEPILVVDGYGTQRELTLCDDGRYQGGLVIEDEDRFG